MKNIFLNTLWILALLFLMTTSVMAQKMPPSYDESKSEPIKYIGDINPDSKFYDGNLPHAVGVQHFQVYRANRNEPIKGDSQGWTYNHQPFLSYWNGKFYVQFLSDLYTEHTPPGKL